MIGQGRGGEGDDGAGIVAAGNGIHVPVQQTGIFLQSVQSGAEVIHLVLQGIDVTFQLAHIGGAAAAGEQKGKNSQKNKQFFHIKFLLGM